MGEVEVGKCVQGLSETRGVNEGADLSVKQEGAECGQLFCLHVKTQ